MSVRIITADVMDGLAQLADESVHCVVTSPPYYGLRSYLPPDHPLKRMEIGFEPTLPEHIAKLVEVFGEVRRVLRKDGTLWLNYGDMWAGSWGTQSRGEPSLEKSTLSGGQIYAAPKGTHTSSRKKTGLKPKDLCLAPHRLAIALQDDGWWVRAGIIWHKPNPMPSSVRDRPTSAHEFVYLLGKSARYFYDAEAIAEPRTSDEDANTFRGGSYVEGEPGPRKVTGNKRIKIPDRRKAGFNDRWDEAEDASELGLTRNARDVWTIATEAFSDAHYATFPTRLAEKCIKAGCPRGGVVLDPFGGSGTVGLVADRLQRDAILIDLNPENEPMMRRRLAGDRGALLDAMEAAE